MLSNCKRDFPIFKRQINGKPLVYLDNAATSQVPQSVIDAVSDFDSNHRANVHRGVHTLSEEASEMYDNARFTVARFINAVHPDEVVFVKNTTEAINTVAYSWARNNLQKDDIILVSEVEHHSNLVPWQMVCESTGCKLEFIPVGTDGKLNVASVNTDWDKVRLLSLYHVSNVLGTIVDVKNIRKEVLKRQNHPKQPLRMLVDGAQSVPHMPINVQKLGADFFAFSGHKMCGPMGTGVLWINRQVHAELKPFLTGGGMIDEVTFDSSTFASMPNGLEAGTPNVSGAVGLAAACDYLSSAGLENIHRHEAELVKYAMDKFQAYDDIIIYGSKQPEDKAGVIAFNVKGIPAHDLATVLDTEGVAVRSGHHCVMPWHKSQELTTTARASIYLYNTKEDIDILFTAIDKARKVLGGIRDV